MLRVKTAHSAETYKQLVLICMCFVFWSIKNDDIIEHVLKSMM